MTRARAPSPNDALYGVLRHWWHHFNAELFGGELAEPVFTLERRKIQRGRRILGCFRFRPWVAEQGETVNEIMINSAVFGSRDARTIASTFVHELTHHWQFAFGKPGQGAYHNVEFAEKMTSLGLPTSATGEPGGPRTGRAMTHYIVDEGPFDAAFHALDEADQALPLQSYCPPEEPASPTKKKKNDGKQPYKTPDGQVTVWGAPTVYPIVHAASGQVFEPPEGSPRPTLDRGAPTAEEFARAVQLLHRLEPDSFRAALQYLRELEEDASV